MDEQLIINQYRDKKSASEIAEILGTYPNKILRILKKNNEPIRDRKESQQEVLKSGRSKHPTKGLKVKDSTKNKISDGVSSSWKTKDKKDLEEFRKGAKERWDKMSVEKKMEFYRKAGEKLRIASIEGSAAEKFLHKELQNDGYEVIMHKKGIGGEFEVDLLVANLNTAIEIDGPQHFSAVYGEETLRKNIKYDSIKNGILISKGFFVIRVKYLAKKSSLSVKRRLAKAVKSVLSEIENGNMKEKLIEIEVS